MNLLRKEAWFRVYESDAKSSRLPACTGCSQHETARDEWCWCPGPSEACRMKGAVSIWSETVVIPGSAALSLAHALHGSTSQRTRTRASGVMGKLWFGRWSKESVVRKEEEDIYMSYNRTPVCVLDKCWAHRRRGLSCMTDARLTAVTHDHTREGWLKAGLNSLIKWKPEWPRFHFLASRSETRSWSFPWPCKMVCGSCQPEET